MKLCRTAFLLTMAALFLVSCSPQEERRHPLFVQGSKARAEGDGELAKENFEKLLKRRPESTAVLLELASVCDELLNDSLTAVYYYNRYLEAVPDAPDAEAIRRWRDAAEKKVFEAWKERFEGNAGNQAAAEIAPPPPSASAPAADNSAEIAKLRQKLEQLQFSYGLMREELLRLRKERAAATAVPSPAAAKNQPLPEFYVVQPGDNPGKIAKKLYGDSQKYTILLRANPQVSPTKLKPGMKLIVPAP